MVMRLSGLVQTGDLQSVIYDLAVRLDRCSVAASMAHADHLCTKRTPQLATYIMSKCAIHTLHKDFTYMSLHNFQYDPLPTGTYFLHCCVHLQEMQLYVANARADEEQGPDNAYDRPFVQLDLADLFKQPRPTS